MTCNAPPLLRVSSIDFKLLEQSGILKRCLSGFLEATCLALSFAAGSSQVHAPWNNPAKLLAPEVQQHVHWLLKGCRRALATSLYRTKQTWTRKCASCSHLTEENRRVMVLRTTKEEATMTAILIMVAVVNMPMSFKNAWNLCPRIRF